MLAGGGIEKVLNETVPVATGSVTKPLPSAVPVSGLMPRTAFQLFFVNNWWWLALLLIVVLVALLYILRRKKVR